MKPRLKLSTKGRLTLISPGVSGMDEAETKLFIKKHFLSMANFAKKFRLNYNAFYPAMQPYGVHCAGKTAQYRQLCGLPSTPSRAALLTVKTRKLNAKKRATK
jgi:hypothetical protein